MYNINSGYVGASRSVRSQEAINSFEVPISMINKSLIDNFIVDAKDDFSKDELEYLKTISTLKWKYVAAEGIIKGDWLYYKYNHLETGSVYKYKTTANKTEWIKEYNSYSELVENHKEYENTEKVFNKLILEKKSPSYKGYER